MQYNLNDIIQFPDQLQNKGSYWQYLASDFDVYLQNYLKTFEQYRKELGITPTKEDWEQLPFGPYTSTSDWKWRRQSLAIFQNLTKDKAYDCALEIGSWNGWLTKFIAKKAKTVFAADYFLCPYDGISNIQTLAENIVAVQCNLDTIKTDFKEQSFDLIVLNHNLAYVNNPLDYIQQLIPLLKTDGMIISLGNTFYRNPTQKIQINKTSEQKFYNKYDINLYIQPIKGYLDWNDWNSLTNAHFKIKKYPFKLVQNIFAKYFFTAPTYTYIIYEL